MTELNLIDLDNGNKVIATAKPRGSAITVTGDAADTLRQIVTVRADLMGMKPGEALPKIGEYGWSNGHLALEVKK